MPRIAEAVMNRGVIRFDALSAVTNQYRTNVFTISLSLLPDYRVGGSAD